jgi:hypothetical protein
MATNPDFKGLFAALFDAQADFIVVGAHAVMVYTEPRYTKDLDVWVRPTPENAARVFRALLRASLRVARQESVPHAGARDARCARRAQAWRHRGCAAGVVAGCRRSSELWTTDALVVAERAWRYSRPGIP